MSEFIPVKDEKLARDSKGVIHNTDHEAYAVYMRNREAKLKDAERITDLEKSVAEIKGSIDLILGLLQGKK